MRAKRKRGEHCNVEFSTTKYVDQIWRIVCNYISLGIRLRQYERPTIYGRGGRTPHISISSELEGVPIR